MEHLEFLAHSVAFQERMVAEAEEAHARVQTKYGRIDALKLMADEQSAEAVEAIDKAKVELEDIRAAYEAEKSVVAENEGDN